jgi:2,4-dienoyl-CoA reductase-like NADH-dependent reductase (Old Yellow Enzyme family)
MPTLTPNKKNLFNPLQIRNLAIRNRIFVSPMCQYTATDGIPTNWHLVHLGSRAVGGAGMVIAEATAVSPEGRISLGDTGLWSEEQAQAFLPITHFIKEQGAVPAIQLAHAGRKASTAEPWKGGKPLSSDSGAWTPLAPSSLPFAPGHPIPQAMSSEDIAKLIQDFERSTRFALKAGFQVVELHMAHGYLLHEFLSPLTNQRQDDFGGSLEKRMRLPLEVAKRVRNLWPADLPVFVRLSATDWVEKGWDIDQTVEFTNQLKVIGIDFIDVSSGGTISSAKIPVGPGFQVPFAKTIKERTRILTGAVGLITNAQQAEDILASGSADAILMARQFLRDPYFPLHAAQELGVEFPWPPQYQRA